MSPKHVLVIVIAALTLSPLLLCCHAQSYDAAPTWLKKGVYAEYTLWTGSFTTPDRRVIVVDGTEVVFNYTMKQFDNGTFRWTCIDLNASAAKIEGVLTLWLNDEPEPSEYKVILFIDPSTRAVYAQNGTLLGTTHLWGPSHPQDNQEMILWDVPPDKATGTITVTNNGKPMFTFQTPKGIQQFYEVSNFTGKIDGKRIAFFTGALCYEYDTGLPVCLPAVTQDEPVMAAFELNDFMCPTEVGPTNVDMGPAEMRIDLYQIFSYVAVGVGVTIMAVAVVKHRRKRL
jgi:hypothetical protein